MSKYGRLPPEGVEIVCNAVAVAMDELRVELGRPLTGSEADALVDGVLGTDTTVGNEWTENHHDFDEGVCINCGMTYNWCNQYGGTTCRDGSAGHKANISKGLDGVTGKPIVAGKTIADLPKKARELVSEATRPSKSNETAVKQLSSAPIISPPSGGSIQQGGGNRIEVMRANGEKHAANVAKAVDVLSPATHKLLAENGVTVSAASSTNKYAGYYSPVTGKISIVDSGDEIYDRASTVHEVGHAVDSALGDKSWSSTLKTIGSAVAVGAVVGAAGFLVTPALAAIGITAAGLVAVRGLGNKGLSADKSYGDAIKKDIAGMSEKDKKRFSYFIGNNSGGVIEKIYGKRSGFVNSETFAENFSHLHANKLPIKSTAELQKLVDGQKDGKELSAEERSNVLEYNTRIAHERAFKNSIAWMKSSPALKGII